MDWSAVEIGIVGLAAFVMAADEALHRSPQLSAHLPRVRGLGRFVPAVLVSIAALLFGVERMGWLEKSAPPPVIAAPAPQSASAALPPPAVPRYSPAESQEILDALHKLYDLSYNQLVPGLRPFAPSDSGTIATTTPLHGLMRDPDATPEQIVERRKAKAVAKIQEIQQLMATIARTSDTIKQVSSQYHAYKPVLHAFVPLLLSYNDLKSSGSEYINQLGKVPTAADQNQEGVRLSEAIFKRDVGRYWEIVEPIPKALQAKMDEIRRDLN
jgi:hypothetical protein